MNTAEKLRVVKKYIIHKGQDYVIVKFPDGEEIETQFVGIIEILKDVIEKVHEKALDDVDKIIDTLKWCYSEQISKIKELRGE